MTGNGGADEDRTRDPLLAKQVLSQLSYSPFLINPKAQVSKIQRLKNRAGLFLRFET
jgi:hypothetical protein